MKQREATVSVLDSMLFRPSDARVCARINIRKAAGSFGERLANQARLLCRITGACCSALDDDTENALAFDPQA